MMKIINIKQERRYWMQVNGINGANVSAPQASVPSVDEVSKSIQNQIANAQMQLQKLSSDREMSAEEKQQRRQEIQKQISELNTKLRQHQMEVRREQQVKAKAKSSGANELSTEDKTEQQPEEKVQTSLSSNSMKAIISAESAVKEANAHGNVSSNLEGQMKVLQSEIKQDARNGNNTERKQDALERLENRVTRVSGAQMGVLSDAVQDMRQTAKQERSVQDDQKVKQRPEDQTVAAEKLNLATGIEAYNKGKFFSNVNIQM